MKKSFTKNQDVPTVWIPYFLNDYCFKKLRKQIYRNEKNNNVKY